MDAACWLNERVEGEKSRLGFHSLKEKIYILVRICSSEKFVLKTTCQDHTVQESTWICWMYYKMKGDIKLHVWFAWTIAMPELCSWTTELSIDLKQYESNTGVVCMYVHSQWCSIMGMIQENTSVSLTVWVLLLHPKAVSRYMALMSECACSTAFTATYRQSVFLYAKSL